MSFGKLIDEKVEMNVPITIFDQEQKNPQNLAFSDHDAKENKFITGITVDNSPKNIDLVKPV